MAFALQGQNVNSRWNMRTIVHAHPSKVFIFVSFLQESMAFTGCSQGCRQGGVAQLDYIRRIDLLLAPLPHAGHLPLKP
jgi:hypothetical protein